MISKYKSIHILLTNVHLYCRGEGSSKNNVSRDETVETGDESVEAVDESIEAGEKHNNHVIIFINDISNLPRDVLLHGAASNCILGLPPRWPHGFFWRLPTEL